MPDSIAALASQLSRDPDSTCRLEGLRWYDGSGGGPRCEPVGLRRGRFTLATDDGVTCFDLTGWTLLPGLCDAHFHLWHEARRRLRVDLGDLRCREEIPQRLAAAPADTPLLALGWDESEWDDPRRPDRTELDAWVPDRPACLVRVCGHLAVFNRHALECLTGQGLDIDPGTGLAREGAVKALLRLFPPEPAAERRALRAVAEALAADGVTAVTEMGSDSLPEKAAALEADFPLRVDYFHAGPPGELPAPPTSAESRAMPLGRKFFLDGSIGGWTAAVASPYVDGGQGQLLWTDAELARAAQEALADGWMLALHAIGERAIEQALLCLERLRPPAGRVRLEHLEMASPAQVERLAALGAVACLQPNFLARWGRPGGLYEQRLGPGWRARFTEPRQLRSANLLLAYGTDSMPARLWPALRAAVDPEVMAKGADSSPRALAAVTGDAAAAAGQAGHRGRVAAGEKADFCLVSGDPVAENFQQRPAVALTVLGGRPSWVESKTEGR